MGELWQVAAAYYGILVPFFGAVIFVGAWGERFHVRLLWGLAFGLLAATVAFACCGLPIWLQATR